MHLSSDHLLLESDTFTPDRNQGLLCFLSQVRKAGFEALRIHVMAYLHLLLLFSLALQVNTKLPKLKGCWESSFRVGIWECTCQEVGLWCCSAVFYFLQCAVSFHGFLP